MKYSIIIPCYDATEKDFRMCLDSIKAQTLQPYEVICIDDASPVKTPQIAKEYGFKYIRHEVNLNNGGARNTGIKEAKGDYLVFINSDDYILPETLEEIDNVNQGQEVIYIGLQAWGAETFNFIPNETNTPYLSLYDMHGEPMKICKKKFILENNLFEEENIICADIKWNRKLESIVTNYTFVPKALYMYQVGHETSLLTKLKKGDKYENSNIF